MGEAFDVSTSATSGVAGRYASALFELADNAKSLDQVAQDLTTFRKFVGESPDLARLIASPVIGRDAQGKALLDQGVWVIMFPEGTRIPRGQRGTYKSGGTRLAVATLPGGEAVVVTDLCHQAGFSLPRLQAKTLEKLKAV